LIVALVIERRGGARNAQMSVVDQRSVHWDPYSQLYYPDPYPVFRRMREEAPIYYNKEHDFYAVFRYEDVHNVLTDRDTFSSAHGDVLEHIKSNMAIPKGLFIAEDPPLHTMHRGILTRVFTPRNMTALEPKIRAYCAKALDPLVESGEFDFITNLGRDMPLRVIGMLLGIPDQDMREIRERVEQLRPVERGKPMEVGAEKIVNKANMYLEYIQWRQKNPSDDLMTQLINVEFKGEDGEMRKLSVGEILIFVNTIASAGNETTNRLIGWIGKVLAEHPEQRRQILENRDLIPQAIEEILRFEPPGPSIARYVTRDCEIHGMKVPKGSAILAVIGSANRDDRKFVDGDTFNIHRERLPHLTFGAGFHNCLGNALARVEGRTALDELLNRFPEWDVDLAEAKLSASTTTRGWDNMPAYTPESDLGRNRAR
jgi:cytochrome P450